MTGIVRTIRRRAQRRRPVLETAHLARSIGQLRLARKNTAVPQAVPGRAVQDNPDPRPSSPNTLAATAEARARASIAAGRLAGLGGSEPAVTAGRRRRCDLPRSGRGLASPPTLIIPIISVAFNAQKSRG